MVLKKDAYDLLVPNVYYFYIYHIVIIVNKCEACVNVSNNKKIKVRIKIVYIIIMIY